MSTRLEREFTVNLGREALSAAMRSPDLIQESENSRNCIKADIRQVSQDDDHHAYEIDVENYGRSLKGEDRSKREHSTTKVRWDLKAMVRRWTWSSDAYGDKVKVTGEDHLVEVGGGTKLQMRADIDVRIPLVGRVAEKKVKAGFEENWPNYVKLLEDFVRRQSA